MMKRKNSRDRSKFWGCSSYPECRGTRPHTPGPKPKGRGRRIDHWHFGVPVYGDEMPCMKCERDELPEGADEHLRSILRPVS